MSQVVESVLGIHHVTAIAGDPQRNLDFYAGLLGLRLVKRTVNFDDPETYHLYYGDEVGTPGSILTFFPWPGARRGRPGSGQVAVTSFAVLPGALGFWLERLSHRGVRTEGPRKRSAGADAEEFVSFDDPDGLQLEIVADPSAEARSAWFGGPGIPKDVALRGFHSVTIAVEDGGPTERVLVEALGLRELRAVGSTRRYVVGDGGASRIVDVRSSGPAARNDRGAGGAGTVHHVAWAVTDDASQLTVRGQVMNAGLGPTPVIDRKYFHSVYFREPGGVLFELATLPPGFAVDEAADHLGERLMLPDHLERHRSEIEAVLPVIQLPTSDPVPPTGAEAGTPGAIGEALKAFVHRYVPPTAATGPAREATLLLLHGTGGDEDDLLPVGRRLLPGAALLSPRGNVNEGGAARFFRRIAEGIFDQDDLALRTGELGDFVLAATRRYGRNPARIVAVGFSNGANIAASLLLRRPGVLPAAVLLSPMVPFEPAPMPDLAGTEVFIGAGRADRIAPPAQAEKLADLLRRAGASVTVHLNAGGHGLTEDELEAASGWIADRLAVRSPDPNRAP